jgi:hypothetical protein
LNAFQAGDLLDLIRVESGSGFRCDSDGADQGEPASFS